MDRLTLVNKEEPSDKGVLACFRLADVLELCYPGCLIQDRAVNWNKKSTLSESFQMFTSQVKIPSKLGTPYEIEKDFTSVEGSIRSTESEPATVDIDEETRLRVDQLEKEHIALTEIRKVELLPLLLDLIEELKLGKIEPKDFDNAAGRIRAQISKIRGLLDNVEGLSESSESRINKLRELDEKITRKRQELLDFREMVMKRDRTVK
ncbi:hypothetical protein LJB42_003097 [Komagataella kurtzmanii]|nr:hypothetical protein LJB42_003097 [Komagataella kurtzmanii]